MFVEAKYSFALIFKDIIAQKLKYVKLHFLLSRRSRPRRGKHSARQSTRDQAEARTHYPQRDDTQKPSSGREAHKRATILHFAIFVLINILCQQAEAVFMDEKRSLFLISSVQVL